MAQFRIGEQAPGLTAQGIATVSQRTGEILIQGIAASAEITTFREAGTGASTGRSGGLFCPQLLTGEIASVQPAENIVALGIKEQLVRPSGQRAGLGDVPIS